ncbi:MAG: hypothetical protein IT305_28900 [Chloroflexi bacterium]|nr:hypothetical protein [Chloroflexota bacterium]
MSQVEAEAKVRTRVLTRDQGLDLLDLRARHYLNMSGAEFMEAWKAGKFNDCADRPEVTRVAMLLPFGR